MTSAKHSGHRQIHLNPYLKTSVLAVLVILLAMPSLSFGFSTELFRAIQRFEANQASRTDRAFLFSRNHIINHMRVKHMISDQTYQAIQADYADRSRTMAEAAARTNGARMRVQQRIGPDRYDAGTDSDYITDAQSSRQVTDIQRTYNEMVDDYLRQNGVETGRNWIQDHDVDFMADPDTISEAEFLKTADVNNDAYKKRGSAAFEAKSRGGGDAPTVQEAMVYHDEMRGFINKKTLQISEKSRALNELMRNRDTRAPDQGGSDRAAWEQRMSLEAEIQIKQAQKAKYFQRSAAANQVLADHAGVETPASSDLPAQAKIRSGTGQSAQRLQIRSALGDSLTTHLDAQARTNEIQMLSILARRNPGQRAEHLERMARLAEPLTPSQKGDVIQRVRQGASSNDGLARELNTRMKGQEPPPASSPSSKWAKAGFAAGLAGDIMAVDQVWKSMENGDHLLLELDPEDSETVKNLKYLGAAALELYPVPVLDAAERGWRVDEKVKAEIQADIQAGKHVNPYWYTFRMMAEISTDVGADFLFKPLMQGMQAGVEAKNAGKDIWQNWKDEKIRDKALAVQEEKRHKTVERVVKIKLGPVTGKRTDSSGKTWYNLDKTRPGELLDFQVERTPAWTGDYKAVWEILDSGRQKVKIKKPGAKSSKTLGKESDAHAKGAGRFSLAAALPPGQYFAAFRIYENASGLQMDASLKPFTISNLMGMGSIQGIRGKKETLSGRAEIGERLGFTVERLGIWDKTHAIEWLVNGTSYRKTPAGLSSANRFSMVFSDIYDPGPYEVAVRLLNNKTGKTAAHQKLKFILKNPSQSDQASEKKPQKPSPKPAKKTAAKKPASVTGAVNPGPVQMAGDAEKRLKPVKQGMSSAKKQHCLNILEEIAHKRKLQVKAHEEMTQKHQYLVSRFQKRLAALNARTAALNARIQAKEKGAGIKSEYQQVMAEQALLKAFEKAHNQYWQQPCSQYIPAIKQTGLAVQEGYDAAGAGRLCSRIMKDGMTDDLIQIRLAREGCVDQKGNLLFDPGVRTKETGQPEKADKKNCRTFSIDAAACQSAFESCMARCKKIPQTSGHIGEINACHENCSASDRECIKARCPDGTTSGVGWDLKCTVCQ